MKLLISEKILQRRKALDLTQEELAGRIGVSAQAISNWERGASLPDAALIPPLAEALGVSTDELFGVGLESDEEVFNRFKDDVENTSDENEIAERFKEYYHRYPNNYLMMEAIVWWIYRGYRDDPELVVFAQQVGDRIIRECGDPHVRKTAVKTLALMSDDENAEKYVSEFDNNVMIRPGIIGRRFFDKGETAKAQDYVDLERYLIFRYILSKRLYCKDHPEKQIIHCQMMIEIIELIGGGTVSDGWLEKYAALHLCMSSACLAVGKKEEGYDHLEKAAAYFEKWIEFEDNKKLSLGFVSLFGNVTAARSGLTTVVYLGNEEYCRIPYSETADFIQTLPFDHVKDESRFARLKDRIMRHS